MPVPTYIYDGDLTAARERGPIEWHEPFRDKGDTSSYEVRQKYWQLAGYYRPTVNPVNGFNRYETMVTYSTPRGTAYLVEESDATHVEPGILEFTRTYASIPRTRYEKGSIVYSQQFESTNVTYGFENPPGGTEVEEIPQSVNAAVKYEYGLTEFSQLYTPKVYVLFGRRLTSSGYVAPTAGVEFLAEDSTQGIYKGGIFFRRSVLATFPAYTSAAA